MTGKMWKAMLSVLMAVTVLTPVYAEESEMPEETGEEMQEVLPEEETAEEIPEETPVPQEQEESEEEVTEEPAEETPGEETPAEEELAEEPDEPEEEYVDPLETVSADSAGVFVRSLYNVILQRKEDESGLQHWVRKLSEGMTAAGVIVNFVMSAEFQKHFPDNRTFVTRMYESILGRSASEKEVDSWTNRLNAGISYGSVMQGFIGSVEFARRCAQIGIKPGKYVSNLYADRYPDIAKFTANLYMTILERGCDGPGLENWIRKLTSGTSGAEVVRGFIESKEFMSRFPDAKTFAAILYRTALSREGSEKEVASWASHMEDGQSYKLLMQGFLNSAEFRKKCTALGIKPGNYYSNYATDTNRELTKTLCNAYRKLEGTEPAHAVLEEHVQALLKKEKTLGSVIVSFSEADAFAALVKTPETYVAVMYSLLLGREASEKEIASWASRMQDGMTWRIILQGLIGSAEYRKRCTNMKVNPGSYKSDHIADKNRSVTVFVNTLYKEFLNRNGDAGGMANFLGKLYGDGSAFDVIKAILGSVEYHQKFPGNTAFVQSLYRALLLREGSEEEITAWENTLNEGTSRIEIARMFTRMGEFVERCNTLGIRAGNDLQGTLSGVVTVPAEDGSGRMIQILYDENGNQVKEDCKMYGYYFHINSETGEITRMTKLYMEGYDLSEWNGDIDLKQYQGSFLILRISWSETADERTEYYIRQCEQYGIPYGVYCYSYALNNEEADAEADFVLQRLKEIEKSVGTLRYMKLGIWFDMEDADAWKKRQTNGAFFDADLVTGICDTFCSKIRNAGYFAGIYASYSWWWFGSWGLIQNSVSSYGRWIAHWGNGDGTMQIDLAGFGHLHQYTCTPLDRDVMYVDPSHFSK